jgi:hypothetical protein
MTLVISSQDKNPLRIEAQLKESPAVLPAGDFAVGRVADTSDRVMKIKLVIRRL